LLSQPVSAKLDFKAIGKSIQKLVKDIDQWSKTGRRITLREVINRLPVLNQIKLPNRVNQFLDHIEFDRPRIRRGPSDQFYELTWDKPIIYGIPRPFGVRFYMGKGATKKKGLSFSIGLPGAWTLNTLLPEIKQNLLTMEKNLVPAGMRKTLKKMKLTVQDFSKIVDWIQFENVGLILAKGYVDPVWGELRTGLNIMSTSRLLGPLEKLMRIIGKDLTAFKVHGVVKPLIKWSQLYLIYPGKLTLFRIPLDRGKPPSFVLRTSDIKFRIGLARWIPTVKLIGGFELKLPGQKDFIALKGFVDFMPAATPPTSIFGGQMDGLIKNLFGLPGFNVGNLGVAASISPVPPHLVGLSARAEVHIGPLKGKGLFHVNASTQEIAIATSLKKMTHKDFIDYVIQVMEAAAKLAKKKTDFGKVKNLFYKVTPPFTLGDLKFYFIPTTAEIFGKKYHKGIYCKGSIDIFGVGGGFDFIIRLEKAGIKGAIKKLSKGVRIKGFLKEIRIPKKNPVLIFSGGGPNRKRGDADDGPVFHGELGIGKQIFFADSFIRIPPLGIVSDSRILIDPLKGFEFDVKHKLGKIFDTELHIQGKPKSLETFYIKGYFKQDGLSMLGNLLTTEANKEFKKAQKNLNKAKADVKRWKNQAKKDIEKWISDRIKDTQFHIDKLQGRINSTKIACGQGNIGSCFKKILIPAWEIEKGFHILHRELTVKRLLKETAKFGVNFVSESAKFGLNTAKAAVSFGKLSSNMLGNLAKGAFNITSIKFSGTLKELISDGKLARVHFKGIILGRRFDQVYQVDFKNPARFPSQIISGFMQIFGPKKRKR